MQTYLDQFAVEGLRTLVLSVRKLDASLFKKWSARYEEARNLVEGKKDKMEELQEELETELTIVGATAIDDRLQDEVRKQRFIVADVIRQLKQAGIKVWVLTGDKVETARTIGFSCNLLQEDMVIHEVLHKDKALITADLDFALEKIVADESQFLTTKRAIVVAGDALTTIMPDEEMAKKVYRYLMPA